MTLPVIDLIFIIIVLACALIACIQGFVKEVFGKGAPFVAIWVAVLFYKKLLAVLEPHISVYWLAVALSFLIIFVIAFLILKIIQKILENVFSGSILRSLDKFLGFVFGLLEGLAIVAVILIVLTELQMWFPDLSGWTEGSVFLKMLGNLVTVPVDSINSAVNSVTGA